jgi:hypothetical protein
MNAMENAKRKVQILMTKHKVVNSRRRVWISVGLTGTGGNEWIVLGVARPYGGCRCWYLGYFFYKFRIPSRLKGFIELPSAREDNVKLTLG